MILEYCHCSPSRNKTSTWKDGRRTAISNAVVVTSDYLLKLSDIDKDEDDRGVSELFNPFRHLRAANKCAASHLDSELPPTGQSPKTSAERAKKGSESMRRDDVRSARSFLPCCLALARRRVARPIITADHHRHTQGRCTWTRPSLVTYNSFDATDAPL